MKTLVIALNSKYIHSSLAPWYLKAACGNTCGDVMVLEHTINENINDVLTSVYLNKPDVAAFSCYIWNIAHVLRLASSLKKLLPQTVILLGGPEVSYDAGNVLREYPFVDFILAGEGEESFPRLLRLFAGKMDSNTGMKRADDFAREFNEVDGLAWRQGDTVIVRTPAIINSLDGIPSPYTNEMLSAIKNRIVYFEASRGCPYSCSYCLSSASAGTRYFSLERIFNELDKLVAAGAKQIKFVDRTFNCSKGRSLAIIRHILEMNKKAGVLDCNFHFEVGADLFDEEMLQVLNGAPKGLFQIEAGVQTVNEAALAAVNRKTDLNKLFHNLNRLHGAGNIHIHADLIAGLPHEDYSSFQISFDRVYNSEPNQLQLGFLKFLKGTRMRENAVKEGYRFSDYPPYEILSGAKIHFDELIVLKGISELVERFYNTARFSLSLGYVIKTCFTSPFRFYERFYAFCREKGLLSNQTGMRELYAVFHKFASTLLDTKQKAVMSELVRLDFLSSDSSGTLPDFMEKRTNAEFTDKCFEYLRRTDISALIPEAAGMPSKQLFKKVHFDIFYIKPPVSGFLESNTAGGPEACLEVRFSSTGHVVLFNYMSRDKVTGRYPCYEVDFNQ